VREVLPPRSRLAATDLSRAGSASYLAAKAQAKNIDLNDLANDLLKQEIRIAESLR
jgi:hypothetical protein